VAKSKMPNPTNTKPTPPESEETAPSPLYPINTAAEAKRMEAVRSLDILDSEKEIAFDEIAQIAAHICNTPIALISIIDQDRQWFKASVGLDAAETPREYAFCEHAICDSVPLVVPNALEDARFAENPFVTGTPWIRAYVGAPLITATGEALGTVCAIDTEPRMFGPAHVDALVSLARCSVAMLAVRKDNAT